MTSIVRRREMTKAEFRQAVALGNCRFVPGTSAKRFALRISAVAISNDRPQISEREALYLRSLVYTFRRQIPADIVATIGDVEALELATVRNQPVNPTKPGRPGRVVRTRDHFPSDEDQTRLAL